MCSCEDDVERSLSLYSEESRMCMKCGLEEAVTIARTNDPLCLKCFDGYFIHRFRATFGKSRLVRHGEEVLLAFSGGQSSSVLLNLVKEEYKLQRLRFIPRLIFVDEGVVLGQSHQVRHRILKEVLSVASQTQFPVYFTKLEEVFAHNRVWPVGDMTIFDSSTLTAGSDTHSILTAGSDTHSILTAGSDTHSILTAGSDTHSILTAGSHSTSDHEGEERLKELFADLQSLTAKENMLISLRRQLLVNIATRHMGINKVLVGDNATALSVRLLGNIAQGRGGTVPFDTGFCDYRTSTNILRPLREFSVSDISSYFTLHKLQSVDTPSLSSLTSDNSIDRLTNSFLSHLQGSFPSTISTIFRTGDKLKISEQFVCSGHRCPLCQVPCNVSLNEEVFSHVAATSEIERRLCYGCRLTVRTSTCKESTIALLLTISDESPAVVL